MAVAAPSGTEWSGAPLGRDLNRQTPDQVINKMLAEKRSLNERTRLTWDPAKVPIRGEGKFVGGTFNEKGEREGGVCLSLPYVIVDRKYYIQNCRIFKLNGDEITIKQVFDAENGGGLYARVQEALDNHLKQAIQHDAALCRHCLKFRSTNIDEMMQHTVDEHPDVIAKMAKIETPIEKIKTDSEAPWCQTCDKTFQNAGGLRLHRLKVHDKAS